MAPDKSPVTLFIILGCLGDLTSRKLLPALYQLSSRKLPSKNYVLGVDITGSMDDTRFRLRARELLRAAGLSVGESARRWCDTCLHYESIGKAEQPDYGRLGRRIVELEQKHKLKGNRIIYLATSSTQFVTMVTRLGEANLNKSPGWTRLVIEKPFGMDLASAKELNAAAHKYFDEEQIYRIDHFLGKETVQNLMVFRFANVIFEQLWNRQNIESVEITVAENLGLEGRAGYYDKTGALRDMVQNHLMQLLTLITMEVPMAFTPEAIRHEKDKVLRQLVPLNSKNVVFGQYTGGEIDGEKVSGYKDKYGIPPDSNTETFVALKVEIANWRWKGVPFFLRTGKRMPLRCTHIAVNFFCAPVSIFHPFETTCDVKPNVLVITLQPLEGFDLYMQIKDVGGPFKLTTQTLSFRYSDVFGAIPDAYETLLQDIIKGDLSLFVSDTEVELSWKFYDDLLHQKIPVYPYAAGTDGPKELKKLGADWRDLE